MTQENINASFEIALENAKTNQEITGEPSSWSLPSYEDGDGLENIVVTVLGL